MFQNLSNQQKGSLMAFVAVMFITPDSLFIRLSSLETWGLVFYRGAIPFVVVFIGMLIIYRLNFFKLLIGNSIYGACYVVTFSLTNITFVLSIQNIRLNFEINPQAIDAQEVNVSAERARFENKVDISRVNISRDQIRKAPAFVEADVFRTIQLLPSVSTANDLHVKVNNTYHFQLQSRDVLHNFSVPAFRLRQDAVPGRTINGWFKPTKTGTSV